MLFWYERLKHCRLNIKGRVKAYRKNKSTARFSDLFTRCHRVGQHQRNHEGPSIQLLAHQFLCIANQFHVPKFQYKSYGAKSSCHIPLGCFSFGLSLTLQGCSWPGPTLRAAPLLGAGKPDTWMAEKCYFTGREVLLQLEERVNVLLGLAVITLRERRLSQVQ